MCVCVCVHARAHSFFIHSRRGSLTFQAALLIDHGVHKK